MSVAAVAAATRLKSSRAAVLLLALLAVLVVLPLVADDYLISVLVLALFMAYLGQAWNIMMGFAGLLSLGHALYVGLGAYTSAALFVHYGWSPWIGMVFAVLLSALAGAIIGTLSFRFHVRGVYFALLTIAFASFTRILFDHVPWVGGSAGLYLPVENRSTNSLLTLRGAPVMFYYLLLAMTAGIFALSHVLLGRRIGFYWQAIREDAEAAQALGVDLFRYRMAAIVLSAALTAAGGVVHAFYYNTLYPETMFSIARSIELILAPIIGGLGTLFGPILGAFVLAGLGEVLTAATERLDIDGIKQLFYGAMLIVIVVAMPSGLWPWLRERLGLTAGPRR